MGAGDRSASAARLMHWVRAAVVALGIALAAAPTFAAPTAPAVDCESLATAAGRAAGLPDGLLPAIARIESGRSQRGTMRAWPWTLNHAGQGLYFDTPAEALAYLRRATAGGRTNIDVGCMQINHYWHGQAFENLSAMLDPVTNVSYAVQYLTKLHARHGSWAEAVRRYHSPDPDRGKRYLARFSDARAQILTGPSALQSPAPTPHSILAAQTGAIAPHPPRVGAIQQAGTAEPLAGFAAWPLRPDRPGGAQALVALAAGQALPGWRAASRADADALYAALIALAESRDANGPARR